MLNVDVIVVGYGPSGLVLAASLGKAGHRVAVVERWPTLYGLPRLTHIDDETARIIQALGDVDEALKDADGIGTYTFLNAGGEILTRLESGRDKNEPWISGYPRDISIFQPDIETTLDAAVQACPSVTRYMGYEAVELHQDENAVRLTIRSTNLGEGPAELELAARFVVGCDGARSFVREAVGITRTDHGFNERWLDLDGDLLRPIDQRFSETVQYCDPARGHMYMPIGKKRMRFEMAVLPGEDADVYLEPAFAWQWLGERYGIGPEDFRIIRHHVYTFEARIADEWRKGAILLAGDAAHTTPPYLGQGACGGMRDGFNLGWKLDLILKGEADESLLDSYELERRPHVTEITLFAIELGKLANEHDPERARERDDMLRNHKPAPFILPKVSHGLVAADTPLAGSVWPQRRIEYNGAAGRFDDVIGNGFILMSREPVAAPLGAERLAALSRIGCRMLALSDPEFRDLEGTYAEYFDSNGISAFIARPDFVVFGSVDKAESLSALVDRLLDGLRLTAGPVL